MSFVPPKPNPAIIGLTRWILPFVLRSCGVVGVECSEEDRQRLRALRRHRVLFTPNHPTGLDPAIIYHLSKVAGPPFFYLCAREVFDERLGTWGWLIRRCGAYSILRGSPDRQSFKMTRELLTRPAVKLVIFPEGETYSQNDCLLPFHSGVVQLVLWAQEDLLKQGERDGILVVPVALKYRYVENMEGAIAVALSGLERAVALPISAAADYYARVRRIGETVVEKLEAEYGTGRDEPRPLGARLNAVKEAIIDRAAHLLAVPPPEGELPDRMRHLINAVHRVTDEEPVECSPYERRLWEDDLRRTRPLLIDLNRLATWIAVYDGYVAADPTPERMVELIRRLEIEVFGDARCTGKQRCVVRLGEAINVTSHWESYQANKREVIDGLTHGLERSVQTLLDQTA